MRGEGKKRENKHIYRQRDRDRVTEREKVRERGGVYILPN